jgi:hypothetical protein
MTESQKENPIHPVQAWLRLMHQFLERVGNYKSIPLDNLQMEFTCAIRQLKLGWPLISHLKSLETPTPTPSPVDHFRSPPRQEMTELEQTKPYYDFWTLAQVQILRACQIKNLSFKQPMTIKKLLNLFIKVGHLDSRCGQLKNPPRWENFKTAPMLFAKSVCILTNSPHDMTEVSGLSFLLTRLEEALGLMPPGITWRGRSLPLAAPPPYAKLERE